MLHFKNPCSGSRRGADLGGRDSPAPDGVVGVLAVPGEAIIAGLQGVRAGHRRELENAQGERGSEDPARARRVLGGAPAGDDVLAVDERARDADSVGLVAKGDGGLVVAGNVGHVFFLVVGLDQVIVMAP